MSLAEIGATANGGVCRLALTDEEIAARRLLIDWAEALGLSVFTDDIGNLFFRLAGSDPEAAPVVTGSHIDTQPTGGKFDGAYGVVAGFEAVEAMLDAGAAPTRSVEVVAWVNEEGSRFSPGMMGSEAFTSRRPIAQILEVTDADGITTAAALEAVLAASPNLERREFGTPIAAFIEAHIEQGPVLERNGVPVGVVTGIQGSRRFRVEVNGEAGHAGTQPMAERRDALLAALRIVDALRATFAPDDAKFTVGLFDVTPNVPSVVPSRAYFSIDLRHPDQATLARLGDAIAAVCADHAAPCAARIKEIATSESLEFPEAIRATIAAAADTLDIPAIPILSLAGHDARQLHYHCPTGMIFTPCKDGVSHNEAESATPADLAAGTRVLAATLVKLATDV